MMTKEKLNAQIDALEDKVRECWLRMYEAEKNPNATEHDRWKATAEYMEMVGYISGMIDVLIG